MNAGAAKACRSDRRLSGRTGKVPREMKRAWAEMSQADRARLHLRWKKAQRDLGEVGRFKQSVRLSAEAKDKETADATR